MLAQNFVKVHSFSNISVEGRRGREATIDENEELLLQEEDANDLIHLSSTKAELNCVMKKTKEITWKRSDILHYVRSS